MQPAAAKAPESALQPRGTASSPGQTPAARSGNTLIHAAAYSAPPPEAYEGTAQHAIKPDRKPWNRIANHKNRAGIAPPVTAR